MARQGVPPQNAFCGNERERDFATPSGHAYFCPKHTHSILHRRLSECEDLNHYPSSATPRSQLPSHNLHSSLGPESLSLNHCILLHDLRLFSQSRNRLPYFVHERHVQPNQPLVVLSQMNFLALSDPEEILGSRNSTFPRSQLGLTIDRSTIVLLSPLISRISFLSFTGASSTNCSRSLGFFFWTPPFLWFLLRRLHHHLNQAGHHVFFAAWSVQCFPSLALLDIGVSNCTLL